MDLPLAKMVHARLGELGLTLHGLAVRLGYRNTAKGVRRLQALLDGDLAKHGDLLARLPAALEVEPAVLDEAIRAAAALREAAAREAFVPHAIIITERSVPSQITLCAVTGGDRARWIELDTSRPRATYARQALAEVNRRTDGGRREVPFFGAALGFTVNYDWCRAVRYDREGQALKVVQTVERFGTSKWFVG